MLASEQVKFPFAVPLQGMAKPSAFNFFYDAHWGQCLSLISHLCQDSNQIIVVTGPSGIGKTSLKWALENRDIENLHLIDDAGGLSLDQIERLLHEKQHKVIMFAQKELISRINNSQLKGIFQSNARVIELEALTYSEMEQFLRHHWSITGNGKPFPRIAGDLKRIYRLSCGIPGKAKQLFTDSLRGNSVLEENEDAKGLSPFTVGLIAIAAISVCFLALVWPTTDKPMKKDALPMPQVTLVSQAPISTSTLEMSEQEPEFDQVFDARRAYNERKLVDLDEKMLTLQQNVNKPIEATDHLSDKVDSSGNSKSNKLEQPAISTADSVDKRKTIAQDTAIPQPQKRANKLNASERNILALNKQHYALQLVASSNEKKIKDFITRNKLEGKASYFISTREGKPWYTVVYGDFANKQAALESVNDLPQEVKNLGPWARQYSNIQKTIKDNRND